MRPAIALLCSALMMSGCSDVSAVQHDLQRLLSTKDTPSPARKVSQISPAPTQKAPEKPAAGLGSATKAPEPPKCPDVKAGAYKALEEPTALPPAKPLLTPTDTKRWVERLEGQVDTLKSHLRDTAASLSSCHAKS